MVVCECDGEQECVCERDCVLEKERERVGEYVIVRKCVRDKKDEIYV